MEGYSPLVKHTLSGTYYYHTDHLGTPILMTDEFGNVVWKGNYEPFGKVTAEVEHIANNIRFPGQYEDSETGLYYNWHRYYDAEVGRYWRSDPQKVAIETMLSYYNLNHYLYAHNDSLVFADIDGKSPVIVVGAIIALLSTLYGCSSHDSRQKVKQEKGSELIEICKQRGMANDPCIDIGFCATCCSAAINDTLLKSNYGTYISCIGVCEAGLNIVCAKKPVCKE